MIPGIWRAYVEKHPWLLNWLQRRIASHEAKQRLRKGFDVADPNVSNPSDRDTDDREDPDLELTQHPTIPALAAEAEADTSTVPTSASLSRRLALSIKMVSGDFRLPRPKRYTYEEWVEFTRLIRLTTPERLNRNLGTTISHTGSENEEGLVNWDWIGDDSPMTSGVTESEWLLERLCESLVRLEKRKEIACEMGGLGAMRLMEGKIAEDMGGEEERAPD
jgi:potassium channel subfamily K